MHAPPNPDIPIITPNDLANGISISIFNLNLRIKRNFFHFKNKLMVFCLE
jgi:hypothetical protein